MSKTRITEATGVLRRCLSSDADLESALRQLRDNGLSKVESIAALADAPGHNLGSAKESVHNSGVWKDRKDDDDAFHKSLIDGIKST